MGGEPAGPHRLKGFAGIAFSVLSGFLVEYLLFEPVGNCDMETFQCESRIGTPVPFGGFVGDAPVVMAFVIAGLVYGAIYLIAEVWESSALEKGHGR